MHPLLPLHAAENIEACIERMNDIDAKTAGQNYRCCNAMMEFKAIHSDKCSRHNRAHLLGKDSKRVAQKFKFTEGEMVSYGGRKVSLNSPEPVGSANPATCWVIDKTRRSLHVRMFVWTHSDLYQFLLLKSSCNDWNYIGKSIVFDTPDGLSGGIITITSAHNAPVKVHDWMPVLCKTGVTWAPVWTNHENEHPAHYLKCPNDRHQPHIIDVDSSDVICGTDLQARNLTTAAVAMLENRGWAGFRTEIRCARIPLFMTINASSTIIGT